MHENTDTQTKAKGALTHAADMHRKVSVTVNIILSAKWTSQSPLISFSSSSSFSLSFLLFHTQVDTSSSSSSSCTHQHHRTSTLKHIQNRRDALSEWKRERWQVRGENTGSTLVICLSLSHPITVTLFHLPPHSSSPLTVCPAALYLTKRHFTPHTYRWPAEIFTEL